MNKLLCVLEVENTLLLTRSLNNSAKTFGVLDSIDRKPNFTKGSTGIFYRPGREGFLDTLFNKVPCFFPSAKASTKWRCGRVWTRS